MGNEDFAAKLHRLEAAMNEIIDFVWNKAVQEQDARHRLGNADADPLQYQYHHGIAKAAFRGLGVESGLTRSARA